LAAKQAELDASLKAKMDQHKLDLAAQVKAEQVSVQKSDLSVARMSNHSQRSLSLLLWLRFWAFGRG